VRRREVERGRNGRGGLLDRLKPALGSFAPLTSLHWGVVAILFVSSLGACELYLRSGALWRLPLAYLLPHQNDRHALVSWEIHQTPPAGSVDVATFGSSIAAAVTELPGDEATATLRERTGLTTLRHLVLATPGGGFEEALAIFENLVSQHRPPAVAIFFTAPSYFHGTSALIEKSRATRMAELMPLRVSWVEPSNDESRFVYWMVQHSEALLYRHFFNAWVRRRFDEGVTRGDWRLVIPYRPYRLAKPAAVPLERLPGLLQYRPSIVDLGRAGDVLRQLLRRTIDAGTVPLLVEDPMSHAVRERMAPILPAYKKRITEIASEAGVVYVDPNEEVDLRGMFADVHHPTHEGGRRYFERIVPHVVAALGKK
jgi:hypothetical protein